MNAAQNNASMLIPIIIMVSSLVLLVGLVVGWVVHRRRMRRRFEALCEPLRLRHVARDESTCLPPTRHFFDGYPRLRRMLGLLSPPQYYSPYLAIGTRHGVHVELMIEKGEDRVDDTTTIAVAGACDTVTTRLTLMRHERCWLDGLGREPNMVSLEHLGEFCRLAGMANDAARVFSDAALSALAAIPRKLRRIDVHGRAWALEWEGIERDTSVIEQAFAALAICVSGTPPR